MANTLFLQSDVADPYAFYAEMRAKAPVFHDTENGIWAVYSHAACKRILESEAARIPPQNPAALPLMRPASVTLVDGFARLANPPQHAARRDAVTRLFACMRSVDAGQLLPELLGPPGECDWVGAVARRLPVLAVMRALAFNDEDVGIVLPRIEPLTRIMLPNKTPSQMAEVNDAAEAILSIADRHLQRSFPDLADTPESRRLLASNLVGLLVQSVDAGRGLLSNALLQALRLHTLPGAGEWHRLVTETLRFDPPIQNTRRVLEADMELDGLVLPRGATVLVVLASANRDEQVFEDGDRFRIDRANSSDHLSFGAGVHACPAHRYAAALAADALRAFFREGRRVALLEDDIAYAPMVNARLPAEIRLRYSS